MLVVTRKKSETIKIPELNIEIVIVQVKGDRVRVGINAPREINIVRGELTEKPTETLEQWLDGWEAAVEAGQSKISREEATERYYKLNKVEVAG